MIMKESKDSIISNNRSVACGEQCSQSFGRAAHKPAAALLLPLC